MMLPPGCGVAPSPGYVYDMPGGSVPQVPAALAGQYPGSYVSAPPAPPRPPAIARGAAPRPAVYRGQAPDEARAPRLTPVSIPSPETLNISRPRPAGDSVDWNATMEKLKALGADHQLVRLPTGGWRFTCFLPLSAGVLRRIEATGATQAEAVRLGLDRVLQERGQRP